MSNFVADFDSIEETDDGVFIKVYSIDERYPFPQALPIENHLWSYVGGGFMTLTEANTYGAKATYKLKVEEEEDKGFQLH